MRFPTLAAGWAGGLITFLDALDEAAGEPLPRLLLAPFRAMVRPLAAHSLAEWATAMGPALVLLVLHYVWVIRADTAFEEAAAEASLRRARQAVGARRGFATPRLAHRRLPPLLRLAPDGLAGRRHPLEERAGRGAHPPGAQHGRRPSSSAAVLAAALRSWASGPSPTWPAGSPRPGPRSRS